MIENKYKPIPFWSWNEKLDKDKLIKQIEWMHDNGIGGFFMHARGGLKTEYLSSDWFECVNACLDKAKELNMEAYAYDENGWPSGFVGAKLLNDKNNLALSINYSFGKYDKNSLVSYNYQGKELIKVTSGDDCLNVFIIEQNGLTDILNKDVVRKFIDETHEKYKENDRVGNLRGFFTDEPQFATLKYPYSSVLEKEYFNKYNENLFDDLGLLFIEKEKSKTFRYRYWLLINELMISSYGKQIYQWCNENNYKFTGHYMEESCMWLQMGCCADILPFYKYMSIPGTDFLGRVIDKTGKVQRQVASVAAQFDKEQVLAETFAMCGWDTTPEELKHISDYHFINGTNLICHHLLPYMEYGQRKHDHPVHFSPCNSWVDKNFKEFNEYLADVSKKLSTSKEEVKVGFFYPIRSCYFNFNPVDPINSVKELDESLNDSCIKLNENHILYHFLDEKLLEESGKVDGNKLILGSCSYEVIVFPLTYTLSKNSEKLIQQFVSNGGKILLLAGKPQYLEGDLFNYSFLNSNISIEEVKKMQSFAMDFNENLRISYRKDKNGRKFFFVVNLFDETETILNGKKLHFNKWESRFIYEDELMDDLKDNRVRIRLGKEFHIEKEVKNYFTIDKLSYSKDGINYSKEMFVSGAQNILLDEKYEGDLFLKYSFEAKHIPSICSILLEKQKVLMISINGTEIKESQKVFDGNLIKYEIKNGLKLGKNEIIVKINFFESKQVYDILYGKDVSGGLLNMLTYDTMLVPLYLVGNFGVYGNFIAGKEPDCFIGDNFYLDKQKNDISSIINDGFPFLRGEIELVQKIDIKDTNVVLSIPERFQLLDITINDKFVSKMMFDHELDISKFVHKGTNLLKIKMYLSNRNLLGPFHVIKAEEEKAVEPNSFEFKGTWKDGESSNFRKTYSFVKNIL